MSYLLITIAGIGHKDLLLNSDIALPILQVKIELTRFFLFAPILLRADPRGARQPARAARPQDARVRRRHPHARDQRPAHPSPAPGARQLLLRAGHRRPRAQPHRRLLPARHVVAHPGGDAGDPAALRATRVPALPRRRHHLGASRGADGRHRAAGLHRRVPLAPGDVVLPRVLAHEPASSHRPGVHRRAAGRQWPLSRSPSPPSPARPSRAPPRQANRQGRPAISWATPCRASASPGGLALRPLPPQSHRHRHGPGGRQGRDAGRALAQLARPRPALCQARPHRPAPGRHDGRQPGGREPRRRRPARGVD